MPPAAVRRDGPRPGGRRSPRCACPAWAACPWHRAARRPGNGLPPPVRCARPVRPRSAPRYRAAPSRGAGRGRGPTLPPLPCVPARGPRAARHRQGRSGQHSWVRATAPGAAPARPLHGPPAAANQPLAGPEPAGPGPASRRRAKRLAASRLSGRGAFPKPSNHGPTRRFSGPFSLFQLNTGESRVNG